MKKEEIKRDPIRDGLISVLHYLSENTYVLWLSLILISIFIFAVTYFSNKNQKDMLADNESIGVALIDIIYSDTEKPDSLRKLEFESLLNDPNTKEGYNIKFIIDLNMAYADNDLILVKELLLNNKFDSNDNMLNSYIYKLKSDVLYSDDVKNAIKFNNKAINIVNSYDLKVKYSEDLINIYIANDMVDEAVIHLDKLKSVIGDITLSISIQNNLDFIDYKLKQILKNKQ